mmetsp:Transcript_10870/g.40554  ORF Transcript_10870/g.40554 Transcript_10870/m.40554 type:complete len:200 (-) Transcript_10870:2702-3301(-)
MPSSTFKASLLILSFAFILLLASTTANTLLSRSHFSKQSSQSLEKFLEERGIPCVACTRRQLVNLSHESQHLPLIKFKPREAEQPQKPQFTQIDPSDPNYDTMVEKMTDKEKLKKHKGVIDQLKEQGFDTSQVERPKDDFDDLLRKARDIREKQEREREEKEATMREERRRRREERKRKAQERAKLLEEKAKQSANDEL